MLLQLLLRAYKLHTQKSGHYETPLPILLLTVPQTTVKIWAEFGRVIVFPCFCLHLRIQTNTSHFFSLTQIHHLCMTGEEKAGNA